MNEVEHQERAHADRESLVNEVILAKRTIIGWMGSAMCLGVLVLVANHFALKQAVAEIGKLGTRLETINERVNVMWYRREWKDNEDAGRAP